MKTFEEKCLNELNKIKNTIEFIELRIRTCDNSDELEANILIDLKELYDKAELIAYGETICCCIPTEIEVPENL